MPVAVKKRVRRNVTPKWKRRRTSVRRNKRHSTSYLCWTVTIIFTVIIVAVYSVSQKQPAPIFLTFFPKRLGIFGRNFTRLFYVPVYAGLQIYIQLAATLTKLRQSELFQCVIRSSEFPNTRMRATDAVRVCLGQGSANFLGSRAGWAPDELAAGQTGKFYVKIK